MKAPYSTQFNRQSSDRQTGTGTATLDAGGFSQGNSTSQIGLGALTLAASSIIDLLNTSLLHFANSSANAWSGTLSIYHWSGTALTGDGVEQILFGTDATGLTLAQLNSISFYSGSGTGFLGTAIFAPDLDGEIIPGAAVPEPATWIVGALVVGVVGWSFLKSRKQKRGKTDERELVRRAAWESEVGSRRSESASENFQEVDSRKHSELRVIG